MDSQEVRTISVGRTYSVAFEQGAVKGQLGFKVEAHSDDAEEAMLHALNMLKVAQTMAPALEAAKT